MAAYVRIAAAAVSSLASQRMFEDVTAIKNLRAKDAVRTADAARQAFQ